jgi:tetratricopeptide (TPR) repeat protein
MDSGSCDIMRLVAYSCSAALLFALAGCVTTGDTPGEEASDQSGVERQQVALYQPEPGLAPRDRYLKSISLLEVGEAGQAKAELQAYLAEDPKGRYSKRSKDLLMQIDADPEAALGKEHFIYRMRSGDSLSSVAKQYLGDPLKFHLLARYNDLENPSQMKAGQTIKVPGKRPAEPVEQAAQPKVEEPALEPEVAAESAGTAEEAAEGGQAETEDAGEPTEMAARTEGEVAPVVQEEQPTAEETEVEQIQAIILKAEESAGTGDYLGAARHYESGLVQFPDDVLIRQLAAANYLTLADQLSSEGRKDEAATALQRAAELDPKSTEINDRLAALARDEKANDIYLQGTEYLGSNRPLDAFEAFTEALKLSPDHSAAGEERAKLIPVVTETYHREAMTYFSRQDLDAALAIWDEKVLTIDPDYQPALLYRAQAIDLKQRLTDIPNEQPKGQ